MSIESSSEHRSVLRGGSWGVVPPSARVAFRFDSSPGNRYYFVGFRLMRRVS
jgi:formylglycine-generating enzyme required for sulfatase activity